MSDYCGEQLEDDGQELTSEVSADVRLWLNILRDEEMQEYLDQPEHYN